MPPELNQPASFPWSGTIIPWSAALRREPSKQSKTLADLPRGESVKVTHRNQGWLFVEFHRPGKTLLKGYVSRELIKPVLAKTSAPLAQKTNQIVPKTRADWRVIARQNAFGVDLAKKITDKTAWLPRQGFEANRRIIADVYDYYGALYRRNPKRFQWAGLARMAGGPFFKGFCDMEAARQILQKLIDAKNQFEREHYIQEAIKDILLGPMNLAEDAGKAAMQEAATLLKNALERLMHMGKDIFEDLAWQHEAYDAMGLPEMKRLMESKELRIEYYVAWRQIDSGDSQQMWAGNCKLLWFEQHDIIDQGYAQLRAMPLVAPAMSALAESPHPWGVSFHEYYSGYTAPSLRPRVPPVLSTRDVTQFRDRWGWLEGNIWPTWKERTEPGRTRLINLSLEKLGAREFY
jgi:hypothetical protein